MYVCMYICKCMSEHFSLKLTTETHQKLSLQPQAMILLAGRNRSHISFASKSGDSPWDSSPWKYVAYNRLGSIWYSTVRHSLRLETNKDYKYIHTLRAYTYRIVIFIIHTYINTYMYMATRRRKLRVKIINSKY